MDRCYGVLLHVTSLPSPHGVGTLGAAAWNFVDLLARGGARVWQVLPAGPTGYGDSPYQALSSFAGNPYWIDLQLLHEAGLLSAADLLQPSPGEAHRVDYAKLYAQRYPLLRKAFAAGGARDRDRVQAFAEQQRHWLSDYALFMALKERFGGRAWREWPKALRHPKKSALARMRAACAEECAFWVYIQYLFYTQWSALRDYANAKNIRILGDLPIYVAQDSVDAWAHPEVFWLDGAGDPVGVAGCPPDGFSPDGQRWGNPLYNWDALAAQDYDWWIRRVRGSAELFDMLRIDHFRGFEAYYAIPTAAQTAAHGQWMPGPGLDFFRALRRALPEYPIVAEDLGSLTPGVQRLLEQTGYPGMKVLLFAFDNCGGDNPYLPHAHLPHGVAYTGTHDNNTARGWYRAASAQVRAYAEEYLRFHGEAQAASALVRAALASPCNLAILPAQDVLDLPENARMNCPATTQGNWTWRLLPGQWEESVADRLRALAGVYCRL